MKQRIVLMALLLVCTMAGTAQAALTTFSETLLGSIGDGTTQQITNSASGTFQFNLGNNGYSAADYTITAATLSYTFYDNDWTPDLIKITTGASDGNLKVLSNIFFLTPLNKSKTLTYTFGNEHLSYLSDGLLGLLATSGNNIYIDQLRLDVTAEANPVPLPSAAWFLGTSLIGVVAIRRRMTI